MHALDKLDNSRTLQTEGMNSCSRSSTDGVVVRLLVCGKIVHVLQRDIAVKADFQVCPVHVESFAQPLGN